MTGLSYEQWLKLLLSELPTDVEKAIDYPIDYQFNKNALDALTVVAFLHPDEAIAVLAKKRLFAEVGEGERILVERFAIFDSIQQYFPWMGDYKNLQKTNFQAFAPYQRQYLPLIASSPLYASIYLDLGRKLYVHYELEDEAEACLECLFDYNDRLAEAAYSLGRIYEKRTSYARAVAYYERCIALDPAHIYALLQLGWIKMQQGLFNEAIYQYNRVTEHDPYLREAHIRLAQAYYALEDLPRCRQFIEVVLSVDEFNAEALALLATIQWKHEQNWEAAQATLQKGLDHPVHGDSGLLLAQMAEMEVEFLQNYDKGRTFYEKSLKAQANQPDTVRKYARLLLQHYQAPDEARQIYADFLQLQPRHAAIRTDFAALLIDYFQDFPEANLQLQEALRWDADSAKAQQLQQQIQPYLVGDLTDSDDDDEDDDFEGGGAAGDS